MQAAIYLSVTIRLDVNMLTITSRTRKKAQNRGYQPLDGVIGQKSSKIRPPEITANLLVQ